MDRYWVTLKVFREGQVAETRHLLGRYATQDAAESAASDYYWNKEVVGVAPESSLEGAYRKVARIAIRSLRLAAAAVIAVVAYSWVTSGPDTSSIPIGQLTGDMIGGSILRALVGGGALWACIELAFGHGPKDSPFN